jgi:rRNA processing protein Gar1
MQSENEHRFHITAGDEYSDRDRADQDYIQAGGMEYKILPVADREDQGEQIISSGFPITDVYDSKATQNTCPEGMIIALDKVAITTDEMLDDINFSDEEGQGGLTKDQAISGNYMKESKMISDLYEEDDTLNKYTGTKNETEDLKEIPAAYNIEPGQTMIEAGWVDDVVEGDKVIAKVNTYNGILDLDNVLFTANKIPFGFIDDVIGKIDDPFYVVKFFPTFSDKTIIQKGHTIYFVNQKAKTIQPNQLSRKGCDASNAFDEELSDDEMECSDDEEETERKKRKVIVYLK